MVRPTKEALEVAYKYCGLLGGSSIGVHSRSQNQSCLLVSYMPLAASMREAAIRASQSSAKHQTAHAAPL